MTNTVLSFIDLIAPIVLGIMLLAHMPCVRVREDQEVVLNVFGFVSIKLWLSRTWIARSILIVLAVACFVIPAFRDYSAFFPSHYSMDVFFDKKGIDESFGEH